MQHLHWVAWQALSEAETQGAEALPRLVDARQALGWWALAFSERVACVDDSVVCEVSASERLFGGRRRLLAQLASPPAELGPWSLAQGPTARIALAHLQLPADAVACASDALPLHTLAEARPHLPLLHGLGCRTWGELRALPRAGITRRCGPELLLALDQAYGVQPESFAWLRLPDVFDLRVELAADVEAAAALLFVAHRLLLQLRLWLQARQRGILALELHWEMDRRRGSAWQGHLPLRTGAPTRDMAHLQRLLAEHLAQLRLEAPAHALRLRSVETAPLPGDSASLLPETIAAGEGLRQMLERLSARLGPEQVLRPVPLADHRPEHMQAWEPVVQAGAPAAPTGRPVRQRSVRHAPLPRTDATLYPAWLLEPPEALALHADGRPLYQGELLQRLAGPQRLEAAWWDPARRSGVARGRPLAVLRDYFLARSARAGLLWIYRELPVAVRPQPGGVEAPAVAEPRHSRWFLHGLFG